MFLELDQILLFPVQYVQISITNQICQKLKADTYVSGPSGKKYLDETGIIPTDMGIGIKSDMIKEVFKI